MSTLQFVLTTVCLLLHTITCTFFHELFFIDSLSDDPYIQEINNDEEYLKTFPETMVRYNFKIVL